MLFSKPAAQRNQLIFKSKLIFFRSCLASSWTQFGVRMPVYREWRKVQSFKGTIVITVFLDQVFRSVLIGKNVGLALLYVSVWIIHDLCKLLSSNACLTFLQLHANLTMQRQTNCFLVTIIQSTSKLQTYRVNKNQKIYKSRWDLPVVIYFENSLFPSSPL